MPHYSFLDSLDYGLPKGSFAGNRILEICPGSVVMGPKREMHWCICDREFSKKITPLNNTIKINVPHPMMAPPYHDILCTCVCAQSCLTLCDPMECSPPASSVGFPRQEYWSRLPFLSPGDLADPGIEPASLASPALAAGSCTTAPLGGPVSRHSLCCLINVAGPSGGGLVFIF